MKLTASIVERLFSLLIARTSSRKPDLIIGEDYLRRWHIIPKNPWFGVYFHEFRHSDDDRALHDHPWWNVSILLKGEYIEHTIEAGGVNVRTSYCAGDIKFRSAKSAHRVELTKGPCWSLFIVGPKIREWGFHCARGWRHWQDFSDPKQYGNVGRGCD